MTWYVLEGPDGVGKTTLARELEKLGWGYQHADSTDTLPILASRMAACQEVENIVWDRAHLGEMVHGPLDRGYVPDSGWIALIEAFLAEKETITVLLTDRHLHTYENDSNRHRQLRDGYERAALASSLHWGAQVIFPPKDTSWDKNSWVLRPDNEGLGGTVFPEVWVLGEQQNPHASVPWPFATRCGTELVWPALKGLDRVRVSNARRHNLSVDPTDLHLRWQMLGRPKVITLGRIAEGDCHLADVPVVASLPHPQWHVRFRAQEGQTYRYQLRLNVLSQQKVTA